ncbi:MAG: aroA [Clostridiales bacterium]|jgi:3-phosphoshikimate 1-carboxyvinyltransferase|nr:aroA [Clostridiales bacterium]
METIIKPFKINKEIVAIPSKSVLHRQLILGMLSRGIVTIENIVYSKDVLATVGILRNLGVLVNTNENNIEIDSSNLSIPELELFANESGSTLRFMIPVVASLGFDATFTGGGRLPERPMEAYLEVLPQKGVTMNYCDNFLPLTISGKLQSGLYELRGDISSQYISGLLMALANLEEDSEIVITTKLESKPYVDITIEVLKEFGVNIVEEENKYYISGSNNFEHGNYFCEGDYSQAAFFLVAGAIGGQVKVKGLKNNSTQGDKAIIDLLKSMGADIEISDMIIVKESSLIGIEIDATDIPDLVPILCVAACKANGTTRIYGVERLKHKESDRINSTINMLTNLGANISYDGESIVVIGHEKLSGGTIDSVGDHRIAMSAAIASLICENEVRIIGSESVNKSYPKFFDDFIN